MGTFDNSVSLCYIYASMPQKYLILQNVKRHENSQSPPFFFFEKSSWGKTILGLVTINAIKVISL